MNENLPGGSLEGYIKGVEGPLRLFSVNVLGGIPVLPAES